MGAFSFQSSKNVAAGEGGMVITSDEALGELCWSLHNMGRVREGARYQHEIIGGNLRMSEWQAAVLLAQLERFPEHAARRDANARYLSEALSEVTGVMPLPFDDRITAHAHHLFICRYDPAAFGGRSRDEFVAALRAEGMETASAGYLLPLNRNAVIRRSVAANARSVGCAWPLAADGLPAPAACPNADRATQHTDHPPDCVKVSWSSSGTTWTRSNAPIGRKTALPHTRIRDTCGIRQCSAPFRRPAPLRSRLWRVAFFALRFPLG